MGRLEKPGLHRLMVLLVLLAVAGGGCLGGREAKRFGLHAERPGAEGGRCPCTLHVGHIRVSPLFERRGFVYRTGEAAYSNDYYHEFEAPPGILMRELIVDWMKQSELFEAVLDPRDAGAADWILEGEVVKLYGDLRPTGDAKGVLEVQFTLLGAREQELRIAFQKTYGAAPRARARAAGAIAEAWKQAASQVMSQLEIDLRERFGLRLPSP